VHSLMNWEISKANEGNGRMRRSGLRILHKGAWTEGEAEWGLVGKGVFCSSARSFREGNASPEKGGRGVSFFGEKELGGIGGQS